ncbi:MAG TPA: VWA domain-containing protein [Thermoflexus sp.]|nr:VWA domain-containing protein [Thermoflexus sp.]
MSGYFLHHLIRFGRTLRAAGVPITPGQIMALVRALEWIPIGDREAFYHAARCTLICRREDLEAFDRIFEWFWRNPQMGGLLPPGLLPTAPGPVRRRESRPRPAEVGHLPSPQSQPENPEAPPVILTDRAMTYSPIEILRQKQFERFSEEEIQLARRLMARLRWRIHERETRRLRPGLKGERLDLRRTVRRSMRHYGEWVRLLWRTRKRKPRPLVVLCDISGSMERYARMLLHFLHALSHTRRQVETFVFGTRLTRITRCLRHRDLDEALRQVGKTVMDWSGGTRIGECLHAFNRDWARRVLGRGAVVMIISDGWDRGDIDLLRREMERLQKMCYRLIWLNPLLGIPGYQPLTRGMQAALPYIDDFLPVHNLASLEQLATHLERLPPRRSARRSGRPRPVEVLEGMNGETMP